MWPLWLLICLANLDIRDLQQSDWSEDSEGFAHALYDHLQTYYAWTSNILTTTTTLTATTVIPQGRWLRPLLVQSPSVRLPLWYQVREIGAGQVVSTKYSSSQGAKHHTSRTHHCSCQCKNAKNQLYSLQHRSLHKSVKIVVQIELESAYKKYIFSWPPCLSFSEAVVVPQQPQWIAR